MITKSRITLKKCFYVLIKGEKAKWEDDCPGDVSVTCKEGETLKVYASEIFYKNSTQRTKTLTCYKNTEDNNNDFN